MIIDMWAELLLLALLWGAHPVTGSLVPPALNTNNDLKVKVPRVAYKGQDVELECTFPWTDPSSLYSIKWWRDNDQFYQYIPKNPEPKMKFFEVNGIRVVEIPQAEEMQPFSFTKTKGDSGEDKELEKSTEFKVSLKDLSLNSSGAFTCEVMSDDNFETLRMSANMTVIDPPDREEHGQYGPIIKVSGWSGTGPLEVRDGERVEALCLARNANPPVLLSWYFNGTQVPREFVRQQTSELVGFNTYTSSLKLDLTANQLWDEKGRVLLQCSAVIPGLFHETAVLELHNPTLRRARLTGFFGNGLTINPSVVLVTMAVILSLHLIQVTVMSPWL